MVATKVTRLTKNSDKQFERVLARFDQINGDVNENGRSFALNVATKRTIEGIGGSCAEQCPSMNYMAARLEICRIINIVWRSIAIIRKGKRE